MPSRLEKCSSIHLVISHLDFIHWVFVLRFVRASSTSSLPLFFFVFSLLVLTPNLTEKEISTFPRHTNSLGLFFYNEVKTRMTSWSTTWQRCTELSSRFILFL